MQEQNRTRRTHSFGLKLHFNPNTYWLFAPSLLSPPRSPPHTTGTQRAMSKRQFNSSEQNPDQNPKRITNPMESFWGKSETQRQRGKSYRVKSDLHHEIIIIINNIKCQKEQYLVFWKTKGKSSACLLTTCKTLRWNSLVLTLEVLALKSLLS